MFDDVIGWYGSIFLWLFLTGIGLPPCPEEAGVLYAAGLTAAHSEMHWYVSWPLTSAGIVCADLVLYGVGRRWGVRLFAYRWVQKIVKPERRQRIEDRFRQHGIKLLLAARLLPPLRTGVYLTAGAIRYPLWIFLLCDGVVAIFGVGVIFLGSTWLLELIYRSGHVAVYVGVGVAFAYGAYRYYRYLREREKRLGATPPTSILELPLGPPVKQPPITHV